MKNKKNKYIYRQKVYFEKRTYKSLELCTPGDSQNWTTGDKYILFINLKNQ